jgi:hypothetical protein
MPESLLAPILTDGARRLHYFNGRVLTAEDLRVEQDALRRRDARLGRALGEGVVEGLEVTAAGGSRPAVAITAGLALSREGEVLVLPRDVTVNVVPEASAADPGDALFVPCPGAATGTAIPVGTGAYVLLAGPAAVPSGLAPRVGLADGGVARSCETRFVVEGIQFRLAEIDLESETLVPEALADPLRDLAARANPTAAERSRMRSLLAHWCLGTVEIGGFPRAHFGSAAPPEAFRYGPLDALRDLAEEEPGHVAPCEVPLAVLFWRSSGIAFVDRWAVRRRPQSPPAGPAWAPHVGARRMAEAEAAFLQFQEHVVELDAQGVNLRASAAGTHFAFLPPGGYAPAPGGTTGSFFNAFETFPEALDEALVRQHIFASCLEEPISLLPNVPRPPLVLYRGEGFVLFRRASGRVPVAEAEEPSAPAAGTTEPARGRIAVVVTGTPEQMRLFAEGYGRKTVRLEVRNESTGALHALSLPKDAGIREADAFSMVGFGRYGADPSVRFSTGLIPAGTYRVSLIASGQATRQQAVTLAAGANPEVSFRLSDKKRPPSKGGKPDRGIVVGPDWDDRFGKVVIVEERFREKWPPREPDPWWDRVGPVVNPPPYVEEWAEAWGGWVQRTRPGAVVDPHDPKIFVNPAFDPERVAESPYAYVAFGERGGYAPVLLTAADRTLERGVATEGALLPKGEASRRVEGTALAQVDALAAGWTGLVAETMGVSEATAGGLIADARAEVDGRKGSLRVFSGVDAALEQALVEAGFTDAVAVANAGPAALVEALGQARMTTALARLLVDEARQVVPAAAWDLGATGLGAGAVGSLNQAGIRTVGDFQAAAADAAGRDRLRQSLGVSDEGLGVWEGALGGAYSSARLDLLAGGRDRAPVTRIAAVDADAAGALAAAGIRTVGDLAGADRAVVAEAVGAAAADAVIAGAREAMPVAAVSEVSPEAALALNREGVRTLGALASANADALAGPLGNRAVAEAAIGGARARLRTG